jgi:hypothetical protein
LPSLLPLDRAIKGRRFLGRDPCVYRRCPRDPVLRDAGVTGHFPFWPAIGTALRCTGRRSRSMAVEKGEYGQHAPVVVGGLGDAQLHENAAHVLLDRALGDP